MSLTNTKILFHDPLSSDQLRKLKMALAKSNQSYDSEKKSLLSAFLSNYTNRIERAAITK